MTTSAVTGFLALVSGASGVASFCCAGVALLCAPARNWRAMAGWGAVSLAAGTACLVTAQAASR
jgi:hypothetical protein